MHNLYEHESPNIPITHRTKRGFYLKQKLSIVGMLKMLEFEAQFS